MPVATAPPLPTPAPAPTQTPAQENRAPRPSPPPAEHRAAEPPASEPLRPGVAALEALQLEMEESERQFRRRFRDALEPEIKAEFINGRIIVDSPVRLEHMVAGKNAIRLLDIWTQVHDRGVVLYEKALVELRRDDVEPDVCFWFKAKSDGFVVGQSVFPPPDFVIEILSPSTQRKDRTDKFFAYQESGVGEYWMMDPRLWRVEPFVLAEGRYAPGPVADGRGDGEVASAVLPEFRVPARALFDPAANLAALRRLLAG